MMIDLVARENRILRRHLAKLERRLYSANLQGKVKPGSQDMQKRTVRLVLGKSADGEDVLSPPIRWKQAAAGRFNVHHVPADNEQMVMRSTAGVVGESSIAEFETYDDDHQPPTDKADQTVMKMGEAKIEFQNGRLEVAVGGAGFVIEGGKIRTTADLHIHNGGTPLHPVGGVDSDGDIAATPAQGIFVP